MKHPDKFLAHENITAVLRIPSHLHKRLMMPSNKDFEVIGEIMVEGNDVFTNH